LNKDQAQNNELAAIVLAAGAARRFGKPKQLEPWPPGSGQSLVERAVRLTLEAFDGPVFVVLGNQRTAVQTILETKFTPERVIPVYNPRWEEGQGYSVAAGVRAVRQAYPAVSGIMIMLTDQPRLKKQTLAALVERFLELGEEGKDRILFPVFEGKRGNPAIFGQAFLEELTRLEGDVGGRALVRKYPAAILEVPVSDPAIHEDADTPEELAKLLEEPG
jgi:molybdenum cofactor cytidylyltransferase